MNLSLKVDDAYPKHISALKLLSRPMINLINLNLASLNGR